MALEMLLPQLTALTCGLPRLISWVQALMDPQENLSCLSWQTPFQLSSLCFSGPSFVQVLLLPGQRDAPVAREFFLQVILLLSVKRREKERERGPVSENLICLLLFFSHLSLTVNFFYFFLSYLMSAVGSFFFSFLFFLLS